MRTRTYVMDKGKGVEQWIMRSIDPM